MIRESLNELASRFFLVHVEASGTLMSRWRDKTSDQDDNHYKDLGKVSLPTYLKLIRTGGEIQVFTSPDGKEWGECLMTHSERFDERSRIGLFVCSGNTFFSSTATFESVEVNR